MQRLPDIVTHTYHPGPGPFRNLCALDDGAAEGVLAHLRTAFGRCRSPHYLQRRKDTEAWLRAAAAAKGIAMARRHPIYFFLGDYDDSADPARPAAITFPLSDIGDQLHKGVIDRDLPRDQRRVSDEQIGWYDRLVEQGRISAPLNWGMIFNADSRFPELAGLWGALVGSFYALLICFLVSFPVGISAAVYLEEFAPKNRLTDLIEVNISNLAAVPSIVFGILGLAIFIIFATDYSQ